MSDDQQVISELVATARKAQEQVADYTQEQIDEVCLSVGWQVYKDENIHHCARTAVEESGMGEGGREASPARRTGYVLSPSARVHSCSRGAMSAPVAIRMRMSPT